MNKGKVSVLKDVPSSAGKVFGEGLPDLIPVQVEFPSRNTGFSPSQEFQRSKRIRKQVSIQRK